MRRRIDGGQGSSLIRQHGAISDLITKYLSHRWLLFVVALFILSKSTFLSGSGERCGSKKHPSLVFQVELFSFSTDRYPRFYLQQLSSPHQPPLCCFIATHLFLSVSNCFQYQLLGILLSGISLVVIRARPHTVWITHSHSTNGPCGTCAEGHLL